MSLFAANERYVKDKIIEDGLPDSSFTRAGVIKLRKKIELVWITGIVAIFRETEWSRNICVIWVNWEALFADNWSNISIKFSLILYMLKLLWIKV